MHYTEEFGENIVHPTVFFVPHGKLHGKSHNDLSNAKIRQFSTSQHVQNKCILKLPVKL
eukprot:TRINITY_DN13928_c0_g1_i1.p1 TRINITY_DN13928_c0_g1~~TRINITY_DN13928_c0_g1_i1.p1  ORF type:complete len:59 (-),score=4.86 TRINITY_DN13928_c0_g1_i1:194-370(-)